MLRPWEKVAFVFIILITAVAFFLPVWQRLRIIQRGKPERRLDAVVRRTGHTFAQVLLQKCTLKNERIFTGLMHVFIFYSALTFDTMTVNHTLEGFFDRFYLFGRTNFGLLFSLLVDVFAILVLIAVVFFIVRRFLLRPKAYRTTPVDSAIIYFFLIAVTLSYLYFEAFVIASHPESSRLAFLGSALAERIQALGLTPQAIAGQLRLSWWLHIVLVYGFIAYVPHSKYFHMFTGPVNVFLRSDRPMGELRPLDIEKAEVFGVEKVTDMTWKDFLDAFACMECGRCQDACPAYASGKPLSPKMILVSLEKHLLAQRRRLKPAKREELPSLLPDVYSEGEIWTCTTCGACQHVCPVTIEHIRKIIGIRQSEVLMQSKFPPELSQFFRNLETNANPWGIGFSKRADWSNGLSVPLMSDKEEAEYLLWVGCAGSFDEEGIKISRAMVKLLRQAGIDFAILGPEEKCCGDSARRLGNEYLFQTLAQENLSLFLRYGVRKIITFCPHGYNTFKHEYLKLLPFLSSFSEDEKNKLAAMEIIPHPLLLDRLIEDGRLKVKPCPEARLTFHDSCYYGRHNGLFKEPRSILHRLGGKIAELKNNSEHSFCCGAGGGLMWMEEKLGQRINHLRTEEVVQAGVPTAATSCPFCLTMLKDGLKDKDRTDISVKDITQLVAEALEE